MDPPTKMKVSWYQAPWKQLNRWQVICRSGERTTLEAQSSGGPSSLPVEPELSPLYIITTIIITSISMTCLNAKNLSQICESKSTRQRFTRNPLAGWQTCLKTPRDLFKESGGRSGEPGPQPDVHSVHVSFEQRKFRDTINTFLKTPTHWHSAWHVFGHFYLAFFLGIYWKYNLTFSRILCDGRAVAAICSDRL